ncbi:MAG: 4Fe-4S dicluster domain-containing protein, partial [Actinobacteria bacterium]|nr:4Fe-4S dicluster domain-containing protein [Actinomycetota bacterium]
MAVVADTGSYPPAVIDEFKRLAEECSICYQCGTCTSSCPSGRELYRGPRRLVRLILAGEIEAALKSDDLWRCTECGTCTEVCRMEIDVASVLSRLRQLEREHGGAIRCPERTAADVAAVRLRKRPRIDNM